MKIVKIIRDYTKYVDILQSISKTEKNKIKRVLRKSNRISDSILDKLNLKLNVNDISVVQIMNLRDDIKILNDITMTVSQKRLNNIKFDLNINKNNVDVSL